MSYVKPATGQIWIRIKTGFEVLITDTSQDGVVWQSIDGMLTGTNYDDMNKLFRFKSEGK